MRDCEVGNAGCRTGQTGRTSRTGGGAMSEAATNH
nr:MAG TPA: hypothetical protein [Caudoviricetes sp.]